MPGGGTGQEQQSWWIVLAWGREPRAALVCHLPHSQGQRAAWSLFLGSWQCGAAQMHQTQSVQQENLPMCNESRLSEMNQFYNVDKKIIYICKVGNWNTHNCRFSGCFSSQEAFMKMAVAIIPTRLLDLHFPDKCSLSTSNSLNK